MRLIRNLIKGLIEIIYPKVCIVCKKTIPAASLNEFVCTECWEKVKINRPPFCQSCGRSLIGRKFIKNTCVDCIRNPLHFDRAFSPFLYEGVIKELIHAFKYKNKDYLGKTLGKPLSEFIKEYGVPMRLIDFIIPVPLHKTKLREREFNQALILSEYLSREFNKSILDGCLARRRNTKTQTELKDRERFLNVRGSFRLSGKETVKNKNILLVDDVLTTGATCSEAALTLKENGANIVYCITLAN